LKMAGADVTRCWSCGPSVGDDDTGLGFSMRRKKRIPAAVTEPNRSQQPLFFSERFGFFLLAGGLCAPSGLSFLFVVSAFSNPEFEMDSYPFAIAEVKSEDTSPFEIAQLS
jgi:hypothetical protein